MRVRRLCSFIVSLLVVASIIFVPAAKSQSAFQYFYAVATPSEIQLWAVSSQQPQQVQTLAIPNVIYANASPNGEWIAFISATDNLGPQSVSVWNIRSRELIEVSRGEVYYSSMLNEYSLRWSPNSQYLAIAANGELLIYNSISSTTATIGRGGNLLHIAWSPDSLSVAAAGWQYTGTGQGANASIQVIEMTTNNLSISYDLTQEQFLYNAPVCDLAWSPGGQFISFRSFCDVADVASPREVYVWDIRVNSIQTVTRGTIEAFLLTPGSIIRGEYDHVWQGENRLIVGLDIYTERDGQVSQTLFYDPIRQTIDVLSPRAFMKLAVNPVSGTLAFQASDHLLQQNSNNLEPIQIVSFDIMISATINDGLITSDIVNTPGGCDLTWSPDGQTLAFTGRPDGNCRAVVESIILVNGETTRVQRFTVPPNNTGNILPIGWLES